MRMSSWTPDIVRFMEDADRLSPYFRQLAAIAATQCPRGGSVLDAGCGMGQLSLALSSHAGRVDAVDRSEDAVRKLARTVRRLDVRNVRPICADMFAWCRQAGGEAAWELWANGSVRDASRPGRGTAQPNNPYDLAVFCLSASFEDAYAAACRAGARRVLVVNKIHAREMHDTRPVVEDFDAALRASRKVNPRCQGMRVRLDYGQPLRSLEDAVRYFGLFRTRTFPHGVTPEQVAELLERRNDAEFPYYLPVFRNLAVFSCPCDRTVPTGLGTDGRWDATNSPHARQPERQCAPANVATYSSPRSRKSATACILECTPSLA